MEPFFLKQKLIYCLACFFNERCCSHWLTIKGSLEPVPDSPEQLVPCTMQSQSVGTWKGNQKSISDLLTTIQV